MSIVIAVDGTAASGKGTLARKLAQHFRFAHLDSGYLYRLVALVVVEAGDDPSSEADAVAAAGSIDARKPDDARIRSAEIGRAASAVAVFPGVRQALLQFQWAFAARPPGGSRGAVIDGRDVGTVVFPTAAAKLFVDASAETRARRRWLELGGTNSELDEATLLADILERDRRDRDRELAPLKPARDALLLDTTDLDIEAAFAAALTLVQPKIEEALKALP